MQNEDLCNTGRVLSLCDRRGIYLVHQYMKAMPQHEFVVWAVGADSKDQGKFKYELPDNVVEIREIFFK